MQHVNRAEFTNKSIPPCLTLPAISHYVTFYPCPKQLCPVNVKWGHTSQLTGLERYSADVSVPDTRQTTLHILTCYTTYSWKGNCVSNNNVLLPNTDSIFSYCCHFETLTPLWFTRPILYVFIKHSSCTENHDFLTIFSPTEINSKNLWMQLKSANHWGGQQCEESSRSWSRLEITLRYRLSVR